VKAGAGAVVRLAVWTAGLVVVARALLTVGAGSSSIPLASPDELSAWVSDTPPADMAVAVVRLAALAATFYLLGVTALAVVARLTRLGRLAAATASGSSSAGPWARCPLPTWACPRAHPRSHRPGRRPRRSRRWCGSQAAPRR
jgi:hypothetical protein